MIFKWEENGDFKTRCESFHINKYIYIYIYIYIEREREREVFTVWFGSVLGHFKHLLCGVIRPKP